jgi:hypothetical protein
VPEEWIERRIWAAEETAGRVDAALRTPVALRAERKDILGEGDNSRQGARNRRSGFAGPTVELFDQRFFLLVTSIHGVRNLRLTPIL